MSDESMYPSYIINHFEDANEKQQVYAASQNFKDKAKKVEDDKKFRKTKKGLTAFLFNTREKLEKAIADGLYFKDKIIPYIGQNCGYDTKQFYKDLTENHKVDIREFKF